MQKVEGSNPFSRSSRKARKSGPFGLSRSPRRAREIGLRSREQLRGDRLRIGGASDVKDQRVGVAAQGRAEERAAGGLGGDGSLSSRSSSSLRSKVRRSPPSICSRDRRA